jgi:hypothetical protein
MGIAPYIADIMPPADPRAFVPGAIAAFLEQTVTDAELLILGDGADPVANLVPEHPRISYVREMLWRPVGAKRNRLCAMAWAPVIAHWDDFDWQAPVRLERQLAALAESGAAICGLSAIAFHADDCSAAWDYRYGGAGPWVYVTSRLCAGIGDQGHLVIDQLYSSRFRSTQWRTFLLPLLIA